jgi:NADPH:quinone reductase-like Zn-dependent oxidoreductase
VGGSVATFMQILLVGPWVRIIRNRKLRILVVRRNRKDLVHVTELCLAGKLVPAIDRSYPLNGVPEALRLLGEGHAKGKIVITMD